MSKFTELARDDFNSDQFDSDQLPVKLAIRILVMVVDRRALTTNLSIFAQLYL